MKVVKNLFNSLIYGTLSKNNYKAIHSQIGDTNYNLWHIIAYIYTIAFCTLFISSFFFEGLKQYNIFYLFLFLIGLGIHLLYRFLDKENPFIRYIAHYILAAGILVFAVVVGPILASSELSVLFMALLVVLPIIIIDRPIWLILMNFLASFVFYVFMRVYSSSDIIWVQTFNLIVYFGVSLILIFYNTKFRFEAFLDKKRIQRRLYIDELTGLDNELSYLEQAESITKEITNSEANPFAVIMFDVNNIKTTNDTYGHIYGCALIVEAAHYIHKLFSNSFCYHVGGDEFIVVMNEKDYQNRTALLKEFDKKMENYFITKEGILLRLTVARGLAEYIEGQDKNFRNVLERADKLMYENKKEIKKKYNLPTR